MGNFILDTNICVDLFNGNLLEILLKLPDRFFLPDVVLAELKDPDGASLLAMGYQSCPTPPKEVEIVYRLAAKYKKPSRTDLFALVAAQTLKMMLLTGDESLKKAAENEHVEVHGLLWLLDKLFTQQIVSGSELINALDAIITKGARLPSKEVHHRKIKWK